MVDRQLQRGFVSQYESTNCFIYTSFSQLQERGTEFASSIKFRPVYVDCSI